MKKKDGDDPIAALEEMFEAGNYRGVRERVSVIEKSDAPNTVKTAARAIRERTEPSRVQLALLAIAAVFIVILSGYEILGHGPSVPRVAPPSTAPAKTIEHIR